MHRPTLLSVTHRHLLKKSLFFSALLLSIGTKSVDAFAQNDDALCAAIAQFANATADDLEYSVELKTDWSVRITNNQISMGRKQCDDQDYAPGKALCSYLVKNTSTEFPDRNFKRVLACLENTPQLFRQIGIEELNIKLWSFAMRDVNSNIKVGLGFAQAQNGSLPSLKIMAKKVERAQ